jgi:adenylate cyclase
VEAPPPRKKSGGKAWIWIVLLLLVAAGAGAYLFLREPAPAPPPPKPAAVRKPAPAPSAPVEPAITDKSIAVLPFENMSTDKENAFFADGVHEDILTNLGKIAELKVIARTSVMEYRGTTKKIPQIAKELGVAFVLEGSVRRQGNKVRITVQLIDGKTGAHVLAPDPYDRDLTDIFAIQSEVSQNIATKLQAAISPGTKAALERAPTTNLAAYDLYLKAQELRAAEPDLRNRIARALPLLENAVQQDPKFAQAWLGIGMLHLAAYTDNGFDHTPARAALVKAALDQAVALDPDDVGTLAMLVNYCIDVRDLVRAEEHADNLKRLFPNHALTFHVFARLAARQNRPDESLANYRKARELDPRNSAILESLGIILRAHRRYDEAGVVLRELHEIRPDPSGWAQATLAFESRGSTAEVEALLAKLPPEARRNDPTAVGRLSSWAYTLGDADEVIRLWEQSGANWRMLGWDQQLGIATAFVVKGQPRKARPILVKERERLVAQLAARPVDGSSWFQLAMTHALLGEKKEALEVRQKMLAATANNSRAIWQFNEVVLYAWLGEKDQAIAELTRRLARPVGVNVHRMRQSLSFKPLQGDPRFEAILNDPKNNAPID